MRANLHLLIRLALMELRGGIRDFRIFLGCLIIGVGVIAGVGTLSSHIEQGLKREAKTLLGGDVEITLSNARATQEQTAFFQQWGRYSLTVNMRAMALHGDDAALVEIKGVDDGYPLLGNVELTQPHALPDALKNNGIVAEDGLLTRLNVKSGESVTLGATPFTLSDSIKEEPDKIAGAFSLGQRVLVRIQDLEKAGLLLPGGLIRYNYHILLNDPARLGEFQTALAAKFPHMSWTVKTFNENNRSLQSLIERLQLFMTLAGLSSLLIGGVGILNAVESYVSKKSETIAVMKTLGAERNQVFTIYLIIIFILSLAGSLIGAGLGMFSSLFTLPYMAQFFPVATDISFDIKPLLLAMMFGMLTVFTFCIGALGKGIEVKPSLLFRGADNDSVTLPKGKLLAQLILALTLISTLMLSASDLKIAAGFIVCAFICFIIFSAAARLTAAIARTIHLPYPWARLAIANLYRPGAHTFSIMLSIGIGLTVLIALMEVEGNFQQQINESIPAQAPSLFFIDIQPYQKDAFLANLRSRPYAHGLSYESMVRGRIQKLNNIPVEKASIESDAKWATESDRGLSYRTSPPPGARIAEGEWWPQNYTGPPLLSMDRKVAHGMGLHIGDTLTLNIMGEEITAKIANLRDVDYTSFQINFAMILSPGLIEKFPATTIATAYIDGHDNVAKTIRDTAKQFPNISAIEVEASLKQLSEIIDHIAVAIKLTAFASLLCGMLVLASALTATLDKRLYDIVVFKVLGARKADIIKAFLTEWLNLALITAFLSTLLGSFGAWLILKRLDWLEFHVIYRVIAEITLLTLGFVALIGFIIHSRIFSAKASTILRNE